jgi:hypothetical protein
MATITETLGEVFQPEGPFAVQATHDDALEVQRRVADGFPWVKAGSVNGRNGFIFTNPVEGIQYRVVRSDRVVVLPGDVEFAVIGEAVQDSQDKK